MKTSTKTPPKKDAPGRVHLLRLAAKNVKTLREVEIDDFGEVLEIRGDTGQGKTSILEAIEGGLVGLDPSMVRKGSDAAEIILELDNARIQRIVRADGGKDVLTVTDPSSGKPIDRAKEFLRALCPEATIFRPLEFVQLGGGDTRGKTERLRQQRNMLLDAMPVSLTVDEVAEAMASLGDDVFAEGAKVELDGIDWDQHGLAVCAALEKVFYDARKTVNNAADDAEARMKMAPAPSKPAPRSDLAACRKAEADAQSAFFRAQADANARKGTVERRAQLVHKIETAEQALPERAALVAAIAEAKTSRDQLLARHAEIKDQIKALQLELEKVEGQGRKAADEIANGEQLLREHDGLEAWRAELAQIDATGMPGDSVDLPALEQAWRSRQEDTRNRELQDAHDQAAERAKAARDKAKAYDALVALFRDSLPARIVQSMKMPVEGLGIDNGIVTNNGVPLHQLGTSEQLRVAVLLAAALNPRTGFVLIDRAESLGSKDRLALADAAKQLNLQLVLTYVDPGAKPGPGRVVMAGGEEVAG